MSLIQMLSKHPSNTRTAYTLEHYETALVNNLQRLPCTTYVFPLEKELLLFLCHEGIEKVMEISRKMEEKAFIDSFLLYAPIYSYVPDHVGSTE